MNQQTAAESDQSWRAWMARIQTRADAQIATHGPLFTTDAADDLFAAYLAGFPTLLEVGDNELFDMRQYHNCHACQKFITRYGGLVNIATDGRPLSPFWSVNDAPEAYQQAVGNLLFRLQQAHVTGVFLTSERTWGTPHTNRPVGEEWDHFGYRPPSSCIHNHPLKTADQALAEKAMDFQNVHTALGEFPLDLLEVAVTLLSADQLYRGDKVLGPATWLRDLQRAVSAEKNNERKANLLWRAVATAPAGFCHPRSGMIGTLLEDLQAGLPQVEVARRFKEKMHPLQYQRAQVAPKAGNVARAESMIEKLGLTDALQRRFVLLDEIGGHNLWTPHSTAARPRPGDADSVGVFSGLPVQPRKVKAEPRRVELSSAKLSWTVFARDVLPQAEQIFYTAQHADYAAIVGPQLPTDKRLFQWDNPYNWYRYYAGNDAELWGLNTGVVCAVQAILPLPFMWDAAFQGHHFDRGYLFVLQQCRDVQSSVGLALFPEVLRGDLHEVRATIEAYSNSGRLGPTPYDGQQAAGILFRENSKATLSLRVLTARSQQLVTIDRWE